MYAGTGISTDSARRKKSNVGRVDGGQCKKLFRGRPMPELRPGMGAWDSVTGQRQLRWDREGMNGPFVVLQRTD